MTDNKTNNKTKSTQMFVYDWHIDETEEEITSIRAYGLKEDNKNICLHIKDFTPYIYLELPDKVAWSVPMAQNLGDKLDEMLGRQRPLQKRLSWKKKLYGANLKPNMKDRKLYPYLFCRFSNANDIKSLKYKTKRPIYVPGIGSVKLYIHEEKANSILQLTCCRKLPTAGWIEIHGKQIVDEDKKLTRCHEEWNVKWKHMFPYESKSSVNPKIMSFDIEVNSSNPCRMPNAELSGDKVFQISCIITRYGDSEDKYKKYLLSLGNPDQKTVGKDVIIQAYKAEHQLLCGFTDLINKENPNLFTGYNILGFDMDYMIKRSIWCQCSSSFDKMGFHKFAHSKESVIKWSSSAYKDQEFQYLAAEGRVFIDLLPLVRRDFKLNNYKLKTVSTKFVGATKDPLTVKGIFKCYRIGTTLNKQGKYSIKSQKAMGVCGKYCVQDSVLPLKIMDKLKTWVGLAEMAKTSGIPLFDVYTKGQQVKVYARMYFYCMYENIIVEQDAYHVGDNERYIGAKVFPPIPGKYKWVIPFDFASLYPTTIIAYNICYYTWVKDDSDIPDSMCNIFEWEDHVFCEHDPKVIRKKQLIQFITKEEKKIKAVRTKRNELKVSGVMAKYKCTKAQASKRMKREKAALMRKITLMVEELSPYKKEKSDIKAPKFPMCQKRFYRFLKKPMGVMPSIIQNFLDARAHTRKVDMVAVKDQIKNLKIKGNEEKKIEECVALLDVLNKRQLAYKVSANSMYGAMGVRKGMLPFMPGAMVTTYMGRTNIEETAEVLVRDHGGDLIYGDTDCVSPQTPLLLQWTNPITTFVEYRYRTVDEISVGNWVRISPTKEQSDSIPNYKIWSDNGFTEIVTVVRCAINKPLSRVVVHVGEVICTSEHSLLREDLTSATPLELKLKDKLCIAELPLPSDTPGVPVYPNNLTKEVIENYEIPDVWEYRTGLSADLMFVWGMFFADGSCGHYERTNGKTGVSTWAINKQDTKLLTRCMNILEKEETGMEFKILDTLKSSKVYKLVATQKSSKYEHRGTRKIFVAKYRDLFYNHKKLKKIPDIVLNLSYEFRMSFFMGYYAGDGSKKDPALSITNKGAIGSAGLFYLLRSIGYQVSINTRADKPDTYKLTGSSPEKKFRKKPNAVKKIVEIDSKDYDYVYDIQTANHHFAAGVGMLVVHNSNYINFPKMEGKSAQEMWDHALHVASEVTKLFPSPMKLEFEEELYAEFLILSKKRYMYKKCMADGIVSDNIGKKGVLLARRDNSEFVRNIYETIVSMIFDDRSKEDIIDYLLYKVRDLFTHNILYDDYVITKSVGNCGDLTAIPCLNEKGQSRSKVGSYMVPPLSSDKETRLAQIAHKGAKNVKDYYLMCMPAQVQLAERMKARGQRVDIGQRLEYVVTKIDQHNINQYLKVESIDYFKKFPRALTLDSYYYLKALATPVDQLLNVIYNKDKTYPKDFLLKQYKYMYKIRRKCLNSIKEFSVPNIVFED